MRPGGRRKWVTLGLLLVLLAALGRVAWSRWGQLGAPQAALEGRYRREEQWIAAEVVQDIAEMTLFADAPRPGDSLDFSIDSAPAGGPAAGVRVSFTLGDKGRVDRTVEWRHHIWSPED